MMAADGQRFCLKWNDFRNSVTAVFEDLRQDEELVDITLCCEGKKVKAHRMMLSACSPYFRELLKVGCADVNHHIIPAVHCSQLPAWLMTGIQG